MDARTAGPAPGKGPIRYLASPLIGTHGEVTHAFLQRSGGVSPCPFDSLNLSTRPADGPGDTEQNVRENFRLLYASLGVSEANLFGIRQVHGERVVVAEEHAGAPCPEADAAVTARPGLAVGVLTADCLPVLLYDPVRRVAGAVHAGWKGTEKGISARTVEVMARRFSSRPADIRAALGPYIGPCCYTVGAQVARRFAAYGDAVSMDGGDGGDGGHAGEIRLDIGLCNTAQLIEAGLERENITQAGACTACENGLFFSYRKDGGITGRQLSFIMIKD
ncbi:MAG: peptidoglycan editing factor PgeF [Thermodesulfobacteriota bacterium]